MCLILHCLQQQRCSCQVESCLQQKFVFFCDKYLLMQLPQGKKNNNSCLLTSEHVNTPTLLFIFVLFVCCMQFVFVSLYFSVRKWIEIMTLFMNVLWAYVWSLLLWPGCTHAHTHAHGAHTHIHTHVIPSCQTLSDLTLTHSSCSAPLVSVPNCGCWYSPVLIELSGFVEGVMFIDLCTGLRLRVRSIFSLLRISSTPVEEARSINSSLLCFFTQ